MLLFFSGNAQNDTITIIDFYGLRKIQETDLRKVMPVQEGQYFDKKTYNPATLKTKLLSVSGVKDAQIATVCCDDKKGGWLLFVGIDEGDSPKFNYSPAPTGKDSLPADVVANYRLFESLWSEAVRSGKAGEDNSKGYALLTYGPAKEVQQKFVATAYSQLPLLKNVIKNSSNAEHRAIAAWIVPFSDDKMAIVPDLLRAARDADETVRNNATRALAVLAKYAGVKKSAGILIPSAPFIDMINSLIWTDRNKGAAVLEALTTQKSPNTINQLKEHALPSLIEMAKWKNPGHAAFSFVILGRMAGVDDKEIFSKLEDEKRNAIVDSWVALINAK